MTARTFPELLQQAGELLYGDNWKTPVAYLLDVDRSTIIRWTDGRFNPREVGPIIDRLRFLLAGHARAVNEVRAGLQSLRPRNSK